MEEKLTEVLDITAYLFRTAKRVRKKYGQYHGVSEAIYGLESAAFETMCGTANVNADEYIECYYKGEITLEELLHHLACPLKKDAEEGYYSE
jgi:hypothetical protein